VRRRPDTAAQFWSVTRLFILVAAWMVLLHLFEISTWAAFYVWQRALADMPSAFYFSAVTYTPPDTAMWCSPLIGGCSVASKR
jgi:hypothetical protein